MKSLEAPRVSLKIYPPIETAIKPTAEELEEVVEIIKKAQKIGLFYLVFGKRYSS